jgi:hypothetical protein
MSANSGVDGSASQVQDMKCNKALEVRSRESIRQSSSKADSEHIERGDGVESTQRSRDSGDQGSSGHPRGYRWNRMMADSRVANDSAGER